MECAGLYIMWMLLAFCTSDEKGIWKNIKNIEYTKYCIININMLFVIYRVPLTNTWKLHGCWIYS